MKRQRSASYGDDFDDDSDADEKQGFKDWPRRNIDPDRSSSSSSHRRRSYSKLDGLRKVPSPYDRPPDDDWEPSRHLRRRFEHEPEALDWRKGYERYRDGGDRMSQASSPRSSYGGDHRMHRSESFSGLRRDFPKGFRSERDRPRREAASSVSWWRSRSSKEVGSEEVRKSPSIDSDSVGRRSHAASPDDHRGKVRSRDSTSGVQSRSVEAKPANTLKASKESGSSSEMEEGELEPDPEPEPETVTAAEPPRNCKGSRATALESENCNDIDHNILKEDSEKKEILPAVKQSKVASNNPVDSKAENNSDRDKESTNLHEEYSGKNEITLVGNKLDVNGNGNGALDIKEEEKLIEAVMDTENISQEIISDQCDVGKDLTESRMLTNASSDTGNANDEVRSDQCNAVNELDDSSKEEGKDKDESGDNEAEDNLCRGTFDASKELEGTRLDEQVMAEDKSAQNVVDGKLCEENDYAFMQLDEVEGEVEVVEANVEKEVEGKNHWVNHNAFKETDESRREGEPMVNDANGDNDLQCKEKLQDVRMEDSMCSQIQENKQDDNNEEHAVEEAAKEVKTDVSALQEVNLLENNKETQCCVTKIEVEQNHEMGNQQAEEAESAIRQKHETDIDKEVDNDGQIEERKIDLETEPEAVICSFGEDKEVARESETYREMLTLTLMRGRTKEYKDKGKALAIPISTKDPLEDGDAMEGPSGRGFELDFRLASSQLEKSHSSRNHEYEKLKLEPLDLSLALPGGLLDHSLINSKPKPEIPSSAWSIQSLPSSFRTNSDGLTTSISFTSTQPFVHNPSCSLNQNSLDNYEHSVGSHPIFQAVDQVSSGIMWQAQNSNDSKRKPSIPLFQRVLLNGNSSHNSLNTMENQHQCQPNGLNRQSSFSRQMSPTNSHCSRDNRSQQPKDKKLLTRERSSSSLCKTEQKDGDHLVINGSGVTEKIISKIIAEPLHLNARMLQEMTDHSVAYLRKTISEMLSNRDKNRQLSEFQEALGRRPDMTMDALVNCPRVLLDILVAIKTGLPDFVSRTNSLSSSDLVEIFLNLKCQNLACRSLLPVDDCDCKVCIKKAGFCSFCMCLVCSKFDNALNTCSWVGCDVCLHWCHTDCGLRDSHIRNGCSTSGEEGATEMQFHCLACHHPSEMFGFVKEVFITCAKDWKAETLVKELQYVRRIFSASNDVRGKRLHDLADEMLLNLEKKANHCEVVGHILAFFSDDASIVNRNPSFLIHKEPSGNEAGQSTNKALSKKEWLPSFPSERTSLNEKTGLVSSTNYDQVSRKAKEIELEMCIEKKPCVDELESVIKFKQAEAKMYQERADDARREAESLRHIAIAKNLKIDEDYAHQIEKLQVGEAEERRKLKFDELQAIERAHREYFNMKMRMEADINDLLLKMEATRRNLNA